MKVARICEGREKWKRRAIKQGRVARQERRAKRRFQEKLEAASAQVAALSAENARLRSTAPSLAVVPVQPERMEVRVVLVLVFVIGLIPCNAVPRVLAVLRQAGWLALGWIPDPSSLVNWVSRVGLGMLAAVAPTAAPWVAIIDSSISYGKAKMLVCLRVPLRHFESGKGAATLADAQCIGLEIRDSWTGEDVCKALSQWFNQSGSPVAIIKDQGTDLKRGVELLRETIPALRVVRDVGHVAAIALKREYEGNRVFRRFLLMVDAARARLSHADASSLRPPKIRAKGRFQGISRVVDWAQSMAELLAGGGRHAEGGLRQRLHRAMPGLCRMRFFFGRFARDCAALNEAMAILKNRGLNQETYRVAKAAMGGLPESSRIRLRFVAWLDETLRTQCQLSIGQTPLLVSSDLIESLFGIVKAILERTPAPEFGTLALATPLFCGTLTPESVRAALERCPHQSLTDWKSSRLGHTRRRARRKLLYDLQEIGGPKREQALAP